MGPNFRSVSFFVWSGGEKQINILYRHTDIQAKIRISLISCSPPGDFENGGRGWGYIAPASFFPKARFLGVKTLSRVFLNKGASYNFTDFS